MRAMRSIGRDHPLFVERGAGFELIDADGHRYIDWVCSWGPLILGHAHPDVVAAVSARTGRPVAEIHAVLSGGSPEDDAELVQYVSQLDFLVTTLTEMSGEPR